MDNASDNPRGASMGPERLALEQIVTAIPDDLPKPPHPQANPQRTLYLTRLAASTYYLVLGLITFCMIILVLFGRPPDSDSGFPSLSGFCLWLIPVFTGSLVVFYMAKPFFPGHASTSHGTVRPRALLADPQAEHIVHGFVARLCRALRAPEPEHIYLSPRPEVVFAPRDENASLCEGKGFDLTIGLPFVLGLNARELAGLLARELAVYTESPGRVPRYQMKTLYERLERTAEYHSDFEQTAEDMEYSDSWLKPLGALSRYAVTIQSGIKNGIMLLTCAVSHKALCNWALEADRFAAQMVGSHEYAGLLTHKARIEEAWQHALREVQRGFQDDRVPEDFPAYVANLARLLAGDPAHLRSTQSVPRHGKAALQPSLSERLQSILRLKAPPLAALQWPASGLLVGCEAACLAATTTYYHELFGAEAGSVLLVPNEAFRERFLVQSASEALPPEEYVAQTDWLGRLTASIRGLAWIALAVVVVFELYRAFSVFAADMTRPSGSPYLRYVGRAMNYDGIGVRIITKVKFLHKGDFVGDKYESATRKTLRAPSTGWYVLSGGAALKRCDEVKESDFRESDTKPQQDSG